MKARPLKNLAITIPAARWLAYAGAGAATALGSVTTADGEIHYSGRLDVVFRNDENKTLAFMLDQPGDSITLRHYVNRFREGAAFFDIHGLKQDALRGRNIGFEYFSVARLERGQYVSAGFFSKNFYSTLFDARTRIGYWRKEGTGYVGFAFDNGAGKQYGWARIHVNGPKSYGFTLLDFAYADPGEAIQAGQITSSGASVPYEGSLGLLAIGAAGLAHWRKQRGHALA